MTQLDADQRRTNNPPPQPALPYRSGSRATFMQRMLERLHTETVPLAQTGDPGPGPLGSRPLAALATHNRQEPTLALLDAWATAADTLSFYQERIANEGYLSTATERRSVLELSRAVGYELGPGVAASVLLAFEVDDAPGSPPSAEVPKGAQVQSIPVPGHTQSQMPQTFETSAALTAWATLNSFRPCRDEPQHWDAHSEVTPLVVQGAANNLKAGDHLLLIAADEQKLARIQGVSVDRAADCTSIVLAQLEQPLTFGINVSATDLKLFVFRKRVGLFGSNAPQRIRFNADHIPDGYQEWDLAEQMPAQTLALDGEYAQIIQGGWVAITEPGMEAPAIRTIKETNPITRTGYGIVARVTQLRLDSKWADKFTKDDMAVWRAIAVHVQSEGLSLSERTLFAPDKELQIWNSKIELDPTFSGPPFDDIVSSRPFIVAGKTLAGESVSETVQATILKDEDNLFKLQLDSALQNDYQHSTVTFHGNLVHATHGASIVDEVLGSGDASQANQRFVLRHTPLTYVAAATASGGASTLSLRINKVEWDEVPSLLNQGPTRRCYILRRDNRGRTIVIFGDGVSGARLPSGQENVVATYRTGLGPEGNVPAQALTLLQARPYGIRSVRNPLAASGGAAPASLQEGRDLVRLANLPLGRLVSLADYEHFARTFAGIGKAQALLLRQDGMPVVQVTVAADGGGQVKTGTALYASLLAALRTHGNGLHRIELAQYGKHTFGLKATVKIDARYQAAVVKEAILTRLTETYCFDRRAFGQGVSRSELIVALQTVRGVLAITLTGLSLDGPPVENRVLADPEKFLGSEPRPLLVIEPQSITLEIES